MKRTIALVLSLIFLLVLVPATALADNDAEAKLEVEIPTATKTLFKYGIDLTLGWAAVIPPEPLTVKLYDNTPANIGGTPLTFGTAIDAVAHKYVLLINDTIYNPTTGYTFTAADLGKKTLTVKYTYTPTGHSNAITVTKDITISVQNNVLSSITASGVLQTGYYAGETLNTSGLIVKGTYTNMTDPVAIPDSGYTITAASDAAGTANVLAVTDPLTATQTFLVVSRTEKYDGSPTEEKATDSVAITVDPAATALVLKEGLVAITTKDMTIGTAATTITATVTTADPTPNACLVASVDQPSVAAINTTNLSSLGTFTITPLSVGTAVVSVRTRGSNITQTIVVNVKKAPTLVATLALDKTTLLLPVNGTYSLAATFGPDDTSDKSIEWSSASPSDVSVDATGTVKVLRNFSGAVVITAKATNGDNLTTDLLGANDKTATCSVSVNSIAVDGISISDTSATLYKGSWKKLSATVTPTGAADPSITWSSSDPTIATVDSTGKVTAVNVLPATATSATATITAQSSTPSIKATCTITVLPAVLITSLTLNKSDVALNVGDEETLTITGTPSNATNKEINWVSENTDVATVTKLTSTTAKIRAASKGSTVIRAEATDGSGKYVSCVITVNNIQVLNVYLDKSSLDLSEGDTATVKATLYPTNATTKTLKWTSSNASVATVDSAGNVVAGSTKGYAIITAAATDGSGKFAECVVLSKPKVYVTGLTINYGTTLDLLQNDSTYLKATILPANASTQTATWTSSNTSVATIDASGLLKGLKLGESTITATADSKTVTIKVTVTNTEYNYGVAANFKRRVNVRSTASGLGKLVGYAYLGDTFKILGKTGAWYYIQYNNTTKGYIWASYLNATKTTAAYTSAGSAAGSGSTASPGSTTSSTPTKVTIANCLYAVNVRSSASTSSTRVGKATLGSTYTYLGVEGDWYKIQYNTTTVGYVYNTFVTLS